MNRLNNGKTIRLAILCLLLFLGCTNASAGVLVMQNGDRISGDIKRIYDGEVYIDPEYADEFKVSLASVAHIESDREFEYKHSVSETRSIRFIGPGQQSAQIVELGGQQRSLALSSLREVNELDEYFDWGGKIDVGLNGSRGNTQTDSVKLSAEGNVKIGDHRHLLSVQIVRERANGRLTKRQNLVDYDYSWLFNRPWFVNYNASYERDPIKALDHRLILGLNLGRDIWNSAERFWSVQAGLGVQAEERAGNSENQAVAQWRMRFRYDIPQFTDMEFLHDNGVTHNLSGLDNTVWKTTTGLSWDLGDDWYVKWSYDWDRESNPADKAKKTDSTLSLGLGKEF